MVVARSLGPLSRAVTGDGPVLLNGFKLPDPTVFYVLDPCLLARRVNEVGC